MPKVQVCTVLRRLKGERDINQYLNKLEGATSSLDVAPLICEQVVPIGVRRPFVRGVVQHTRAAGAVRCHRANEPFLQVRPVHGDALLLAGSASHGAVTP